MSVPARVWSLVSVLIGVLFVLSVGGVGVASAEALAASETLVPSAGSGVPVVDARARTAGVTEDWLGKVRAQIELEEYNASVNERGLQAPNRAHNLRTYFEAGGIEVVPRTGEGESAWNFTWRTTGWGREGCLVEVTGTSVEPVASGSRVTYVRDGLDEWYENKREGLEQGFAVRSRPEGEGLLCIEGSTGSGLRAELRSDERAIDLIDGAGARVLRYAELHVRDADGREVASRLELDGDRVAILIDDVGAAYPLTVDPLMTSPSWTAESDQTGANFGRSVGTAGDVNGDGYSDVIVGALHYGNGETDEGRAYVYYGSASGLSLSAGWTAESNQAEAYFGCSVGAAGDVNGDGYSDVIVGAPWYGQTKEGRAFVYHGSASGLSLSAAWTAESDQAYAQFGISVGTAGDVNGDGYSDVIVGAYSYDNGEADEGRAYVYYGSAGGLALAAAWTAESDQATAEFGCSVGSAGDVNGDGYSDVIVGALYYSNDQPSEGRAYVYLGGSDGFALSADWTAQSNQAGAQFGTSVGTAGDVNGDGYSDVIVGASTYDNGETDEGRAFVYLGSVSGLDVSAAWTAESDQASAYFGISVGTAGDVNGDGYSDVIVGAHYYDNGQTDEGRAYVYHGSAGGLAASAGWTAESNQASACFANSVGTAGDVNGDGFSDVIVGAYQYDNGQNNEGRAYVYHGSASGLATSAAWTAESDQAEARLGYSVGTAGDVNGDGYSDVVVGAFAYDNGETDEGRAYVYCGSASGLSLSASWTGESDQAGAHFGRCVGSAGDVNGDGYSDVIVGARLYDNGETDEGRAYLYYGSAGGLALSAGWTAEGDQASAYFGNSVGAAGDVNGDGYSDVIVSALFYDNGETDEGRAYVYFGSAGGLSSSAGWTAESDQATPGFGTSVGTAGDVNGDGYSDVIVGAPYYDYGELNEGGAALYYGSPGGLASSAGWTAESDQVGAFFGWSVGTAGDVNGDGYSDVIVGAQGYDGGEAEEGRAYVYHGSANGLALSAAWTAESDQAGARFGFQVAAAGDVNGDGYSDVIVSANWYDDGETNEGRAYVYHGSAGGLALSAAWTAEGDQADANFGKSVGTAGDVNGDGYSDVIVGADNYDNGQPDEGRAYVYHGSAGGLALSAAWTAEGDQSGARFGSSVGTAGDVNADGYSDVIVGAIYYANGQTTEGRAFVYHGSASGLALSVAWTAESDQASAKFGQSVDTAGDVNGDGYSDVIVGAFAYDNGETDEGRAYVYHGSAGGLSLSAAWTAESDQAGASFGWSVGTAGDVNGDGYSDVIVGAYHYDNGESSEGRAYVYQGSAGGLALSPAWTAESDQADAWFGWRVGTAGDVNGDGYSDVIASAYLYGNGEAGEGRAYVYYGNGGDGLHRIARQAQADDSAPIALLGKSGSNDGFMLKAVGRTPLGRGNVRLQYEVKPLGTPFNGSGLVTGSAYNTGAPGAGGSVADLSGLVSGLTSNTMYHWRLRTLTDSPFFPRSPWFSLPFNCATEADVRTGTVVGVADREPVPGALSLGAGAPNPFEGLVHLSYTLPERGRVRIVAYDVTGREVVVLRDGVEEAGQHVVNWDGRGARGASLPAGVYFVQLNFGGHKEARKVVLTR